MDAFESKRDKVGMDPSKLEQRVPEVGLKKLLAYESPAGSMEALRRTHRDRSKQERLELAYEKILKGSVEYRSEDESTDEDYCPENSEDSVTLSEEDSSDDDYTPNGEVSMRSDDLDQNDSEANENGDESLGKGTRRSKRLTSKTA